MNRKLFALMMALILVFSLAFVACGDDEEEGTTATEGTEGGPCKTMQTPTACDDDNPCDTGYTCTAGFCVEDAATKLFEDETLGEGTDEFAACVGKDISMGLCNVGLYCDTDVICKMPKDVTNFDVTICADDTPECDADNPCDTGYSCVEGVCVEDTVNPCDADPCLNEGEICTVDDTATDGYTCACDTDMEVDPSGLLEMCIPVDYCTDAADVYNAQCNAADEFAIGNAAGGDDCTPVECTDDTACAYLHACDDPDNIPTTITFICNESGYCVRGTPAE